MASAAPGGPLVGRAAGGQHDAERGAVQARRPRTAIFPDGTRTVLPPDRDPREVFADWRITPQNPWFARCIVNRAWYGRMGRGLIHAPDDIRNSNPPSNPALLACLRREFVAG